MIRQQVKRLAQLQIRPAHIHRAKQAVAFLSIGILQYHVFTMFVGEISPGCGASMLPTLDEAGQALVLSKTHRRGRNVRVGDVVVFRIPDSAGGEHACKRVVGLAGDYVHKGQAPPNDGFESPSRARWRENQAATGMLQVPQGHVWVLGDNLAASFDSRKYGPVPLALVRGKVVAGVNWWGPWALFPSIFWMENGLRDKSDGVMIRPSPS